LMVTSYTYNMHVKDVINILLRRTSKNEVLELLYSLYQKQYIVEAIRKKEATNYNGHDTLGETITHY